MHFPTGPVLTGECRRQLVRFGYTWTRAGTHLSAERRAGAWGVSGEGGRGREGGTEGEEGGREGEEQRKCVQGCDVILGLDG